MTDSNLADVRRDFTRVSPEIVAQAAKYQAAILADVAGRRGTLDRVAPVAPGMKLAGPALTVEVRAGDNLMIHAAMAMAKPGDVLVVDGKGDTSCASWASRSSRPARTPTAPPSSSRAASTGPSARAASR